MGLQESENIRVVVRVRPLTQTELRKGDEEHVACISDRSLQVVDPRQSHGRAQTGTAFQFGKCFGPESTQDHLFAHSGVNTLLDHVLEGYSATVFAYGPTGSGKTFTITGRPDSIVKFGSGDATDGLVIRAVESLYNKVCDSLPLSSNGLNRIGRMRVSAGCNAPHVPTGVQSTAAHQPPSCCRCGRSSAMAYSSKSVPRAWRSTTSRSIPSPRAPQRSCATLPAPRLVTRLRRSRPGHRPPPLLARLRRPHQPPRQV